MFVAENNSGGTNRLVIANADRLKSNAVREQEFRVNSHSRQINQKNQNKHVHFHDVVLMSKLKDTDGHINT